GREVERRADEHVDARATPDPEPPTVARKDALHAPVRHRHERDAALERESHGARLAAHRPLAGIAGERALRVDDDGELLVDEPRRRLERIGPAAAAFDRDLPREAQDAP